MNQAEKYHSTNFLQIQGVEELLQKFKRKMKWDGKKEIIDIGCGPGDITYNSLFPLISKDAKLLGIDKSERMIQYADSQYQNSRLHFEVFDILDPKIVEKYETNFDMAFSFHCIHWIQNQRTLMKNLYSILKPGSEILLIVVVHATSFELLKILGESPKWSPYMKDYKNSISPYHHSADPISDIANLMHDVGFHINENSLASISYTFPSNQVFHDWMEALNPFSDNIPKHLAKEYEQEWKKIILEKNLCTFHEDQPIFTYSTMSVFARR